MQAPEQKTPSRYLVELRRPNLGWSELEALTSRARAAAGELRNAGTPVRFLRAVFVPEDETCFLLFEGQSQEIVCRAAVLAGAELGRFAETVSLSSEVDRTWDSLGQAEVGTDDA